MWYQLYVDYKNIKYKITEPKKCFEINLAAIEEKAKNDPTILTEVIYHNENYYFSKSKESLKRKVVEIGWRYADLLNELNKKDRNNLSKLENEIKNLNEEINNREEYRKEVLKKFSNHNY